MAKWIRVKDRLPEEDGYYLVKVEVKNKPIRIYKYAPDFDVNDKDSALWISEIGIRPFNWLVTHWMPLPEPPKEDAVGMNRYIDRVY